MDLSNYNIYIDINRLFNTIFLPNIKYIIFFSVIFIIVSSIIFVVISYIILKLLKMKIYNNKYKQFLIHSFFPNYHILVNLLLRTIN